MSTKNVTKEAIQKKRRSLLQTVDIPKKQKLDNATPDEKTVSKPKKAAAAINKPMVRPHVDKYKQVATQQILATITPNLSIAERNLKFKAVKEVSQTPANKFEPDVLKLLENTFQQRMDKWGPGYAESVVAMNFPPTNSDLLVSSMV